METATQDFFHAYASAPVRKNTVQTILVGQQTVTDQRSIMDSFQQNMKSLLREKVPSLNFNPKVLYLEQQMDLDHLQQRFTREEMQKAVRQLANNEVSGPDSLPHEFIKEYWNLLQDDIFKIFEKIWEHGLDLSKINKENIVMIPKKEKAVEMGDFRPISIINIVPKLITKVLSNRLRMVLPKLVSYYQTTFTRDRHIAEISLQLGRFCSMLIPQRERRYLRRLILLRRLIRYIRLPNKCHDSSGVPK